MRKEDPSDVYEWQVLLFGTTCSPCCATYALQKHVHDNQENNEDIHNSVLHSYVDNRPQRLPTIQEAKQLLVRI